MDPNWLWLIPVLGFVILESASIVYRRSTRLRPLTYWLRETFGISDPLPGKASGIGFFLAAGIIVWLGVHFLVES